MLQIDSKNNNTAKYQQQESNSNRSQFDGDENERNKRKKSFWLFSLPSQAISLLIYHHCWFVIASFRKNSLRMQWKNNNRNQTSKIIDQKHSVWIKKMEAFPHWSMFQFDLWSLFLSSIKLCPRAAFQYKFLNFLAFITNFITMVWIQSIVWDTQTKRCHCWYSGNRNKLNRNKKKPKKEKKENQPNRLATIIRYETEEKTKSLSISINLFHWRKLFRS